MKTLTKITLALAVATALLLAPMARAGDVSHERLSSMAPSASTTAHSMPCGCQSAQARK
jgi:hypothetical protein